MGVVPGPGGVCTALSVQWKGMQGRGGAKINVPLGHQQTIKMCQASDLCALVFSNITPALNIEGPGSVGPPSTNMPIAVDIMFHMTHATCL